MSRANFTQTVNQWIIFDWYEKYEKTRELEEKNERLEIMVAEMRDENERLKSDI